MKNIKIMSFSLAMAVCLLLLSSGGAVAAGQDATLYDTGSVSSYEYRVNVYLNKTIAVNQDAVPISLCVIPYNSAVSASTVDSWIVLITLYDGTTNKTVWNQTITGDADDVKWFNSTFSGEDFVVTDTAVLWISLQNSTYVEKDTAGVDLVLYSSPISGLVFTWIPIIFLLGIIGIILAIVKRSMKK